jgi:CheY-like chemotaxis protein
VHSGKEALQMHETQDYDIILLDIGMPDIDGISCTKSIRKREAKGKKNTVIIAVTAHAMADERENILSCGVNAIVTKPVLEEDLLLCISREFSQVAALHLPNPNI